jgi:hypothetical protein
MVGGCHYFNLGEYRITYTPGDFAAPACRVTGNEVTLNGFVLHKEKGQINLQYRTGSLLLAVIWLVVVVSISCWFSPRLVFFVRILIFQKWYVLSGGVW